MTVDSPSLRSGARKRRRGVVAPYDFSRPTTLAREQSRALELAFESFARGLSTTLLTRLRQQCTVVLTSVAARSYEEHLAALPGHGTFVTFRTEAGGESGLLSLSGLTVLTALDYLLGGRGRVTAEAAADETRETTDIERRLVDAFVVRALADLGAAFEGTSPMAPVLVGTDGSSQFLSAASPADVVLVADLVITLGEEGQAQDATVMLPLAPVLARLAEQGGERSGSEEQRRVRSQAAAVLSRSVPELPVEVSARMTSMAMSVTAISRLAVGDVLHLPHPTARPLDVVTNDVVLARAVAGTSGTRLACLVVSPDEETR